MRTLPTLAGLALAFSSTLALAATQSITVFDGTGAVPTADPAHPMVAVDTGDRSHIVWAHTTSEGASIYYNIFYKLIAADGSTLIDATQISSTLNDSDSFKPQIAVNGTDIVYVSWHGNGSNLISLIGLDPSKDDLSGDAASLAAIERFAEKTDFTSTETGGSNTSHPYIDVDSAGNVHILVHEWGNNAYCAVYDATGTVSKALTQVVSSSHNNGVSSITAKLDANDKMHITTVAEGFGENEVAYSMVDCAAGSVLIDSTLVSTDDTLPSMQPSLVVDAGTAYIIWLDSERGESNCTGGQGNQDETFDCPEADNVMQFIALDPSLDDQNGNAASLAAITKVATKSIATPATIESEWYPRMGMTETGDLQILFYADGSTAHLYGTTIDTNGDIVIAATEIMNDATTAEPTSNTKASVDNRASVYPEAQNIMLSLRDIVVPPAPAPPPPPPPASDDDGIFGVGIWSLLGLPVVIGLLRFRRRK